MENHAASERSRSESISSLSVSRSSSIDYDSPPGTPIPRSPSPLFFVLDLNKPRKELDEFPCRRRVSALHALIFLIIISSGGFHLGRYASSTRLISSLQEPSCHDTDMDFLPQQASFLEQGGRRHDIPFIKDPRAIPPTRSLKAEEGLERRKRFAAHVIHPALLTVLPAPTSIAIVIDRHQKPTASFVAGNQLAEDLLSEIFTYRGMSRITVIFVDGEDSKSGTGPFECPRSLMDVLELAGNEDVEIECSNLNPFNGEENYIRRHHDVTVVLANCGYDRLDRRGHNSKWEQDLYASTKSVAVKCVGRTYPLDHPARLSKDIHNIKTSNIDRIEHFFVPDLRVNPSSDSFLHATDYDIFDERGITTNLAVGFRSIKNGLNQWRLTEANYQVAMHQRWKSSVNEEEKVQFFDSADMLRIQFPSKQSAASSCQHYKHLILNVDDGGDEEMFCDEGLDPQYPNVSAKSFYVGQSQAGKNAGRGVFTSVDLELDTYLMAETYAHDVIFSFQAFNILENMVDNFCLPKKENESSLENIQLGSFQCIVGIYYDAYGYNNIAGGMPVNSGINTFINHGCNGSANIADELEGIQETEFTMLPDSEDPDPGTYVIPAEFRSMKLYNPNYERNAHIMRYDMFEFSAGLSAHTELLDNYVAFGGEKYFLVQLVALKEQCSGSEGTVLNYENTSQGEHKYDMFGSPFIMDIDAVMHRNLADEREIGNSATDE